MSISELMNKLHHKDEQDQPAPKPEGLQVPKPPEKVTKEATQEPLAVPAEKPKEQKLEFEKRPEPVQTERPQPRPEPKKRWGFKPKEVTPMDDEGVILDLGEGMSINVPIKKRMSIEDFLRIAERVKRIEELDMDHSSYNEGMREYQ